MGGVAPCGRRVLTGTQVLAGARSPSDTSGSLHPSRLSSQPRDCVAPAGVSTARDLPALGPLFAVPSLTSLPLLVLSSILRPLPWGRTCTGWLSVSLGSTGAAREQQMYSLQGPLHPEQCLALSRCAVSKRHFRVPALPLSRLVTEPLLLPTRRVFHSLSALAPTRSFRGGFHCRASERSEPRVGSGAGAQGWAAGTAGLGSAPGSALLGERT